MYANPNPHRLAYTVSDPAAVVAALNRDGVALLKEVIPAAEALRLGALLTGYAPLPHEERMQGGSLPNRQNLSRRRKPQRNKPRY